MENLSNNIRFYKMKLTHQRTTQHGLKLLFTMFAMLAVSVHAKNYQVEAIVFENLVSGASHESSKYVPVPENRSFSRSWPLEPSMLNSEVQAITYSKNYSVLGHYSWGQAALPSSRAPIYPISEPSLNGWIKIYANNLLFANIELEFNGYRMSEKRRLKLNEKHYFDHPKFGVLLRVSRLAISQQDEVEKQSENLNQ